MFEKPGNEGVNFQGKRGVNAADPINDKDVVNLRTLIRRFAVVTASTLSSICIRNIGLGYPVYAVNTGRAFDSCYSFRSLSAGTNLGMYSSETITFYLNDNIVVNGITANTITSDTINVTFIDASIIYSGGSPLNFSLTERIWTASTGAESVVRNNNTGNEAEGIYSIIGGAYGYSLSNFSVIAGGSGNTSFGNYGVVSGGLGNRQYGLHSFIGGGAYNLVSGQSASVVSGFANRTTRNFSSVLGGFGNINDSVIGAIVGGTFNTAKTNYATVVGGSTNISSNDFAVNIGGYRNQVLNKYGLIGNGIQNIIYSGADFSTILNGRDNTIQSGTSFAAIVAGSGHTINSNLSNVSILGGYNITALSSNTSYNDHIVGRSLTGVGVGLVYVESDGHIYRGPIITSSGSTSLSGITAILNTGATHGIWAMTDPLTNIAYLKSLSAGTNINIYSSSTENIIALNNYLTVSGLTATSITSVLITATTISAFTIDAQYFTSGGTPFNFLSNNFTGITAVVNTGSTHGIWLATDPTTKVAYLKALSAGTNINIYSSSTENIIALNNNISVNGITANTITASTIFAGLVTASTISAITIDAQFYTSGGTPFNFTFDGIRAISNTGSTHGIWSTTDPLTKIAYLKSLSAGTNIIISSSSTENTIALSPNIGINSLFVSGNTILSSTTASTLTVNSLSGGGVLMVVTDNNGLLSTQVISGGTGNGTITGAVNTGFTHGIYAGLSGNTVLVFKSLSAGTNINIYSSTTENIIALNNNISINGLTANTVTATTLFGDTINSGTTNIDVIFSHTGHTHPLADILNGTLGDTIRHNGTNWIANNFLYNPGHKIGINTTLDNATFGIKVTGGTTAETAFRIINSATSSPELFKIFHSGLVEIGDFNGQTTPHYFGDNNVTSKLTVLDLNNYGGTPHNNVVLIQGQYGNFGSGNTALKVRQNLTGSRDAAVLIEHENADGDNQLNQHGSLIRAIGGSSAYGFRTGLTVTSVGTVGMGGNPQDPYTQLSVFGTPWSNTFGYIVKGFYSGGSEAFYIRNDATVRINSLTGATINMVVADANGILSTQAIPTGGAGAATLSGVTNIGIGNAQVYKQTTSQIVELRSFSGGNNINIISGDTHYVNLNPNIVVSTLTATTLSSTTINAGTFNSGLTDIGNIFVTNGQNVGVGTGQVFKQKLGNVLQFKSIYGGGGTSISNGVNGITIYTTAIPFGSNLWISGDTGTNSLKTNNGTNTVNGNFSLAGGNTNTITGNYNGILNGANNTITGGFSIIGGGQANLIQINVNSSSILGGSVNIIQNYSNYGFIGGGKQNFIDFSKYSVVAGGYNNRIIGYNAGYIITGDIIGGGNYNFIYSNNNSVIGGGKSNRIGTRVPSNSYSYNFIGGGSGNTVLKSCSFIGTGKGNNVYATYGAIINGIRNRITANDDALYNLIGNGKDNLIHNASNSTILNGRNHYLYNCDSSAIIGGYGYNLSTNNTVMVPRLNIQNISTGGNYLLTRNSANGFVYQTAIASFSPIRITNGLNTYTGGTVMSPSVNISGGSFNVIIASGQSRFTSLSATTFSAGTINSGSTNIGSLFSPTGHTHPLTDIIGVISTVNNTGGTHGIFAGLSGSSVIILKALSGSNNISIYSSTTENAIYLNPHISVTSLTATTLSATTLMVSNFSSGTTPLESIFVTSGTNVGNGTVQIFKDKTGSDLRFKTISAVTPFVQLTESNDVITITPNVSTPYLNDDFSTTSNAYQEITGLEFNIAAGEVWTFDAYGQMSCSTVNGMLFQLATPSNSVIRARHTSNTNSVTSFRTTIINSNSGTSSTVSTAAGTLFGWEMHAWISASTTSGNVKIKFRSSISGDTSTILKGTYLFANKVKI